MTKNKLPVLILVSTVLGVSAWMILVGARTVNVPAVRLVYDIERGPGFLPPSDRLTTEMIAALSRRVDPYNIRKLTWRSLAPSQIEVVLPLQQPTAQQNDAKLRDLKHLLRGSGALDFHILVTSGGPSVQAMKERLAPTEPWPAPVPGDDQQWFEVAHPADVKRTGFVTAPWQGKLYILAWMTRSKSMDHRNDEKPWQLTNAAPGQAADGSTVVKFSLDTQGASDFAKLTGNNMNQPLGVFLGGKLINAATIRSVITGQGQIAGGSSGFSKSDIDYLVNTLNAGSLPAELSEEPLAELQTRADVPSPWRAACEFGGVLLLVVDLVLTYVFLIRRPQSATLPPPLPPTMR